MELTVCCDASAKGVGGVLSQRAAGGPERAVAYVSRKLTSAEQGYSQIHREALAIVYCVKKFHQYIYGRKFTLKTDHKPLVSIFGPYNGVPVMAASRMQRWAVILSAYDFNLEYVRTDDNAADILSRLPVGRDDGYDPPEQTYLHFASNEMLLDNESIKKQTARDPLLSRVYGYIENGWPDTVDIRELEPFFNRKRELYTELGCVMWGHRLVVPEQCRPAVLRELHEPHMGIVKTKAHARSYVWWPGLDEAVEATCRSCEACAAVAAAPRGAPSQPWRWPAKPYDRVHVDFLGPIHGQTYLITVDARSKWIEAHKMSRTTAEATIAKLRESWCRWGLPRLVVSDNGPPFSSKEFGEFLTKNGISQMFSAPYHPASNGAAENAVKIIKSVIKKAHRENIDSDIAIARYLLVYHNTPHCTTGESPARLLQGRSLRTRLDAVRPDHRNVRQETGAEPVVRNFQPGELVWYRDFSRVGSKWLSGEVMDQLGKCNYSVRTGDGSPVHRHVDQMRKRLSGALTFPSRPTDGPEVAVASEQSSPPVSSACDIAGAADGAAGESAVGTPSS